MVNQISLEDMMPENVAAKELKQEASGGKGSPLERRLADAILENNQNMGKQNELIASLTEAINGSSLKVAQASDETRMACQVVNSIVTDVVDAVKNSTTVAVTHAIPLELDSLMEVSQAKVIETSRWAVAHIEKAGQDAAQSIEKSQDAADEREKRAREKGLFASLGAIGKAILTLGIVGTIILIIFFWWVLSPIVKGEAQITYTEFYQSELDATKLELIKTQNELEAYKDAYPEGLVEQRLHDLNEKNAREVDDYQGNNSEG